MANKFLIALASIALSLTASVAFAQQSPFYVSGSAGAIVRQDFNRPVTFFNGAGMTAPGTDTTTYNAGPDFNVALGMRLPFGFRIEGELGYANYSAATQTPFSANPVFASRLNGSRINVLSGGVHNLYTSTVNAFYDLPVPGRFVPYVGGGAGFYHDESSSSHSVETNGTTQFVGNGRVEDNAMVLGEVGVSFKVTDKWAIAPAYRFDHFFAPSTQSFNANIFKLGVTYSF